MIININKAKEKREGEILLINTKEEIDDTNERIR